MRNRAPTRSLPQAAPRRRFTSLSTRFTETARPFLTNLSPLGSSNWRPSFARASGSSSPGRRRRWQGVFSGRGGKKPGGGRRQGLGKPIPPRSPFSPLDQSAQREEADCVIGGFVPKGSSVDQEHDLGPLRSPRASPLYRPRRHRLYGKRERPSPQRLGNAGNPRRSLCRDPHGGRRAALRGSSPVWCVPWSI